MLQRHGDVVARLQPARGVGADHRFGAPVNRPPPVGRAERCPIECCYPDVERTPWSVQPVVAEPLTDYMERVWWGDGSFDFHARWTPQYHKDQAASYAAHAGAVAQKPGPISSRFD